MCQEAAQGLNTLKHETQAQDSSTKLKRETQAQRSSAELKHKVQAQSSSIKLKHKTQAQNSSTNGGDASRVGKRRNKELNPTLSTDAGRVAPIRDWSPHQRLIIPHRYNKKSAFRNARSSMRNALFILQFQVTRHMWVRLEIYESNVYS